MLFNSIEFFIFLPLVFILYWHVFDKNIKLQNFFVVLVSYIFYGWWDWRFLLLIAFTTGCSFINGLAIKHYQMHNKPSVANAVSIGNVVINLAILGVFKYYNFFVDSLQSLMMNFDCQLDYPTLNIILPVGISFYTFQALSYTIDVHRNKIEATNDPIAFFAFVSFFPQLVAGPIERATNLLPQFMRKRTFDYDMAADGCRQMLWGFCKKILIADQCATFVNAAWMNYQDLSGINLFIAALLFCFQIYGDFSGYSDIAIGTSKLFGVKLMTNFKTPYFSRDIAEYWKRWHISLNTWFVDYVYIPLGGSRRGKMIKFRNTMIIFLLSGLWHGANWTFVLWGLYHGLLFLPLMIFGANRRYNDVVAADKMFPSLKEFVQMLTTFFLVFIGFLLFRADSVGQCFAYVGKMLDKSTFLGEIDGERALLYCFVLLIIEWLQRNKEHAFELPCKGIFGNNIFRYVFYFTVIYVLILSAGEATTFIYFQF